MSSVLEVDNSKELGLIDTLDEMYNYECIMDILALWCKTLWNSIYVSMYLCVR